VTVTNTSTGTDAAAARPATPKSTGLPLLLLGRSADPSSERGVECPGDLPPASDPDLVHRARRAREKLGNRAFVLGHHYQRDEVIQFADVTGDSFKLARDAAARPDAEYIIFCGVHFMAESADILTSDNQQVILPDLAAGCSMADMATLLQVDDAWTRLTDAGVADVTVPITYMNSSADIKAFCGRHGGAVCTSSNARQALEWAFSPGTPASPAPLAASTAPPASPAPLAASTAPPASAAPLAASTAPPASAGETRRKVLFLPDQHLGRNTAVLQLGMALDDCVVLDPHQPGFGVTDEQLRRARMLLWKGHCSVHGRFSAESVVDVRSRIPDVNVLVHPECRHEVVVAADDVGSTEYIISTIAAAPSGSAWAIGTELNLVKRLANAHRDKSIVFLDKTVCFCSTMNRIDLPHLVWALESLAAGRVVNRIEVDADTTYWARVALDRMLALPGTGSAKD
jgi:quinolinate synthase